MIHYTIRCQVSGSDPTNALIQVRHGFAGVSQGTYCKIFSACCSYFCGRLGYITICRARYSGVYWPPPISCTFPSHLREHWTITFMSMERFLLWAWWSGLPLDSFVTGEVYTYVGNKNKVMQLLGHSTEMSKILFRDSCAEDTVGGNKSILLVLSDRGPDNRASYDSIQVLFLLCFSTQTWICSLQYPHIPLKASWASADHH